MHHCPNLCLNILQLAQWRHPHRARGYRSSTSIPTWATTRTIAHHKFASTISVHNLFLAFQVWREHTWANHNVPGQKGHWKLIMSQDKRDTGAFLSQICDALTTCTHGFLKWHKRYCSVKQFTASKDPYCRWALLKSFGNGSLQFPWSASA